MLREQDERPRRPPAQKVTPDGMDERSDNLGDTDRDMTDLRSGKHKFELGRNPRGAPVSVNEAIIRYKEAQARKFSEHITKPREIEADVSPAAEPPRGGDTSAQPEAGQILEPRAHDAPPVPETTEIPISPSFSDSRTAYRERKRAAPPSLDSADSRDRGGSEPRLRFKEQPEGLNNHIASSVTPVAAADSEDSPTGNERQTQAP